MDLNQSARDFLCVSVPTLMILRDHSRLLFGHISFCARVPVLGLCHLTPDDPAATDFSPEADSTSAESLATAIPESTASMALVCRPPTSVTSEQMAQLQAMALSLGYVVTPINKWAKAIAHTIASGLRTREGEFIYQSAALRMPEVPREAVLQILPPPTTSSDSELLWSFDSASEVAHAMNDLLPLSGMQTAGASRAIQRASEPVIRVVATMMGGLEIRHLTASGGSETLSINFMYVLMGEMGDLHPPKDSKRREIALPAEELTELRQIVLTDVLTLAQAGAQLSPGWWRQLGEESRARVAEAHLTNLEAMRAAAAPGERIPTRDTYVVARILGLKRRGWLRVEWEGYHPSWEEWRMEGEVGAPVVTWEPRRKMVRTDAYKAWEAATEAEAEQQ